MIRYLIGRIGQGLIVIVGVTISVFVTTRLIGDPVNFILPLSASLEQRARLRSDLGFDRPVITQFFDYLSDVIRLDFGTSAKFTNRDTLSVVLDFLPRTLQLVAIGMIFALSISLVLGMLAAIKPGRISDKLLVTMSLAGLSMPQFFLGQGVQGPSSS